MRAAPSLLLMFTLIISGASQAKTEHVVESEVMQWQRFQQQHTLSCQLVYSQLRKIHNPTAGVIKHAPHRIGDAVKKNDLLITFDNSLLKLQLQKTEIAHQQALWQRDRNKKLFEQKALSVSELNQAQTTLDSALIDKRTVQTQLSQQTLYAPFDAVISQRLINAGDSVAAHTHLLSLVAPDSLQISANVDETLFMQLKLKQTVQIQLAGAKQSSGYISRIHPSLNSNQQGTIEVRFTHLPDNLFSGQHCQLQFKIEHEPMLSVPLQALRHDRQGAYLWSINQQHKTARQQVKTGRYFAERVEIKAGLKSGQRVVINGFPGLKKAQKVLDIQKTQIIKAPSDRSIKER
ncbi:MAG: efflux RND transporter periplasmic adaptor subunit [Gammaproteobacteria bacterium]|nr:efflux RND transporter periplasmic adaptor subunit [Gammaproteobacteria bacterium]